MSAKPQRQIRKTRSLMEAVLGAPRKMTKDLSKVLEALAAGKTDVPVEIPWYEDGGTHQILLQHVADERVFFINPARQPDLAPGTILNENFPRRVETGGLESTKLKNLEKLFERGKAVALLP